MSHIPGAQSPTGTPTVTQHDEDTLASLPSEDLHTLVVYNTNHGAHCGVRRFIGFISVIKIIVYRLRVAMK